MAYAYTGQGNINIPLNVNTPAPLDTRTVVKLKEDLYSIPKSQAYNGMTVANINDGNLYMLVNINEIDNAAGWKASYEAIQIETCTRSEYTEWQSNTDENFQPKKEGKYLRRDVYYYIYEDETTEEGENPYYVTSSQLEEWSHSKASTSALEELQKTVSSNKSEYQGNYQELVGITNDIKSDLDDNYYTKEEIAELKYATEESVTTVDNKFENYYTSEETNNIFVTKESLKGGLEGEDSEDFVFVKQSQYDSDKQELSNNLTTSQITLLETVEDETIENIITSKEGGLLLNDNPLAFEASVPKIQLMETKEQYDNLEEIDETTYYYICDDETIGYLTNESVVNICYSKSVVDEKIQKLEKQIAALEQILKDNNLMS